MYLSTISILFFGMILLISTSAMPSPLVYQTNEDQSNISIDNAKTQSDIQRSEEFARWFYRRSSPLCDYRLQFRPLPLTAALCGYGHINKEESVNQMNPFKYG